MVSNRKKWTDNEINILQDNYSLMSISDIMKLLPEHTYNSIVNKAKKLSLKSYVRQQQLYSDDDINFIKSNWELKSDDEIASLLNRTKRAIKAVRCSLGLFRQDNEKKHYEKLTKFFRGQIYEWKILH